MVNNRVSGTPCGWYTLYLFLVHPVFVSGTSYHISVTGTPCSCIYSQQPCTWYTLYLVHPVSGTPRIWYTLHLFLVHHVSGTPRIWYTLYLFLVHLVSVSGTSYHISVTSTPCSCIYGQQPCTWYTLYLVHPVSGTPCICF